MGNFGLDYEHLHALNPDVVVLSMPAYGLTGPYASSVGYGPTMEAASGLSWYCRYRDLDEPFRCGPAYPDPVAGLNAAFALLLGLLARDWRPGGGAAIDLSQMESTLCSVGDIVVQSQSSSAVVTSLGDSHSYFAPWTSFVCADGRWLFVGVESDIQWAALVEQACLSSEWKTLTRGERVIHSREIEAAVQSWARGLGADEAAAALQGRSVPAAAVASGADLIASEIRNPHGTFTIVDHPVVGPRLQPASPFRWENGASWQQYLAAPTFGADLPWVVTEILRQPISKVADLLKGDVCFLEPPE